jgi:hypothetical protein
MSAFKASASLGFNIERSRDVKKAIAFTPNLQQFSFI